jgi:hypothetical protein
MKYETSPNKYDIPTMKIEDSMSEQESSLEIINPYGMLSELQKTLNLSHYQIMSQEMVRYTPKKKLHLHSQSILMTR